MTELLRVESGLIRVRDTDGRVAFDSGERLFQATDYKTGSLTIPTRACFTDVDGGNVVGFSQYNTYDEDHALGSVNAHADVVVGATKVTAATWVGGIANVGWFNANGTIVLGDAPTFTIFLGYTFMAVSGSLILRERICAWAAPGSLFNGRVTLTIPSFLFEYKLYAGSFV